MVSIKKSISTRWQQLKKNKFITNAGAYISGSVLQKASGFLLIPLWARFLTPEDYGITGTLQAYAGVLTVLLAMGLHGSVVRQYYDYTEDNLRLKSYITSVMLFQALVAGLVVILLNIWGPTLWYTFTTGSIPFDPYVRLALWSAYLGLIIQIPLALYRARQKAKEYVIFQYSKFLLTTFGSFVFVVGLQLGATGVLLAQFIAILLISVIAVYLAFQQWFTLRLNWSYVQLALAYGLPLVPHLIASWVLNASDRVILERFVSLEELGLYNFGYSLGMVMSFLVMGINQAWSPSYYKMMKTDPEPEQKIIQVVSIYVVLVGGICLFGVLFARELVHLLMPPRYYGSVLYIAPVLFGYLFLGFYFFASMPLHYYKKTKIIPIITTIAALMNIGLNLWLIPFFGAIAAAWTTSTTYIVLFLIYYFVGQKYQKLEYPMSKYGFLIIIVGFATILVNMVELKLTWMIFIKLSYFVAFGITSYFLIIKPALQKY